MNRPELSNPAEPLNFGRAEDLDGDGLKAVELHQAVHTVLNTLYFVSAHEGISPIFADNRATLC